MSLNFKPENTNQLKSFLNEFNICEKSINEFLGNKKIVEKNENIYLVPKKYKFDKNEIANKYLIFLKLKKQVPSMYLLNFIKENSKNVNIKNYKKALNYTYGKDIILTKSGSGYVLVTNENLILGIGKFDKFKLINIFNIGEYLKEN